MDSRSENIKLLVVDDELIVLESLRKLLSYHGFHVEAASSGHGALALIDKHEFDLVITDLAMPGMNGLELLTKVKEKRPDLTVVFMTAYGTVKTAVQAIKQGAYDFIEKPFEPNELIELINGVFERRLFWENKCKDEKVKKECRGIYRFKNIIGYTPKMHKIFAEIVEIAKTDISVLIIGENGTGKELVANAVHYRSSRKGNPHVKINCGALAEGVVESELFGHEKGAFTGAMRRKKGIFESADKGTLFLDEIGELSPNIQIKLLRVLETSEFQIVGGNKTLKSDFRLISASNKDLNKAILNREFREDLYYRINTTVIELPPLRDRRADIPLLADYFLKRDCERFKKNISRVSTKAMVLLMNYEWRGNVRELSHAIERSVVYSKGVEITVEDIPDNIREGTEKKGITVSASSQTLTDVESSHIYNVLLAHQWNIKKVAEALNITRTTLYNKIEKHGINKPAKH